MAQMPLKIEIKTDAGMGVQITFSGERVVDSEEKLESLEMI